MGHVIYPVVALSGFAEGARISRTASHRNQQQTELHDALESSYFCLAEKMTRTLWFFLYEENQRVQKVKKRAFYSGIAAPRG
jgi:hypothetical protein